MTQVITFQHKNHTFFVSAKQRDALNEALVANDLSKCEMNSFDSKFNLEEKAKDQPDDNKAYVPNNYSSEDFLALLDQDDPRGYIRGAFFQNESGGAQSSEPQVQSETKGEQQDSEEETQVKELTSIEKAEKQLAKVV